MNAAPVIQCRLTRTLKRSSETPSNSSADSAYSTATINNASSDNDYQNVMTVSDDNVYCEIASPAGAAAAYAHQGWTCGVINYLLMHMQ